MALTDLFRPKYKHSDPQVRADYVRQMSHDEGDLLLKIAGSDKDPEVRRLAVSKIEDAEALVDLVAHESSAEVRREAHDRAASLWSRIALGEGGNAARDALARLAMLDDQAPLVDIVHRADDAQLREAALARITDERALAEVVRKTSDTSLRASALDKISSDEILRAIAVDETRKAIGVAAVDRIADVEHLEQIAVKAKSKHVRARASRRRAELASADAPERSDEDKRSHAERVQLLRQVKRFVRTDEWIDSRAQVSEAQERWQALGDGHDAELAKSFAEASARYEARYQSVGLRAIEAARARAEAADAERIAEVEARERQAAEAEESRRRKAAAAEEQAEAEAEVDSMVADAKSEADPEKDAEAMAAAEEARREARAQRDKVNLARLDALCIELEELAAGDRFREIDRKLGTIAKTYAGLKMPKSDERDALVERYEAARRKAVIRSSELREADEWKRWAAMPKLEALIARAQELLEREDRSQIARELKSLQVEWKGIGPGPHAKNQELWERFKGLCDQVYERVRGEREAAATEQSANYERKLALCEQVEALKDSTDWDETAQRIKALQAEWKAIGPVPRKKSKAIWQRFRGACDAFFERRKPVIEERFEELRDNLAAKQALCDRLEALAEAEGEWDEIQTQLAGIRQEWRTIGHVPREDYAALSERYRVAGDRVFARRAEAENAKREQALAEIDALITRLDTSMQKAGVDSGWDDDDVSDPADDAEIVKAAVELRSAMLELDFAASDRDERARALIRAALEAHPEAFDGSDLDPQASKRRRLRLIERLEELLPSQSDSVSIEALSPEQVAAKLREALAANALGIVTEEKRPVGEVVEEIRVAWNRLGPVPGREGIELGERFEIARQRVLDAYSDPTID